MAAPSSNPTTPPSVGAPWQASETYAATEGVLAATLASTVWLPTVWPDDVDHLELFAITSRRSVGYEARGPVREGLALLVGRVHTNHAPIFDRPMAQLDDMPWPTWESANGPAYLLTWIEDAAVTVHLLGSWTRSEAILSLRSLRPVHP